MFVDTHCHLTYSSLRDNLSDLINNCEKKKISRLITIGTNLETSLLCSVLSQKYDQIFSSIGIHPSEVNNFNINNKDLLLKLYKDNKKNIAFGETGLDFYRSKDDKDKQINLFENHISLANIERSAVIIHTRQAEDETLSILKNNINKNNANYLVHCFTGSLDFAKKLLDFGCYISFSGIITFKNCTDLQNVVRYIPNDRILIETDFPFLSPHPLRGKNNTPLNIILVAKKVAELKNINLQDVETMTYNNCNRVFKI